MRHHLQNSKVKFYIGDVRDKRSVDGVMSGVDYVFHAAALKQVPSCEFFPAQAVRTNVLGTENVLDSAIEHGVKNVVVLSTDKAAYPINAMGISKAMMEKVAIAKGRQLGENGATTICCTPVSYTHLNDFVVFQIFHAIIINVSVFYIVKKYTQYKFSAILLYALFGYTDYNMAVSYTHLEGELLRIKGHKRVIVRLEGVVSVATSYIPGSFLEKIK